MNAAQLTMGTVAIILLVSLYFTATHTDAKEKQDLIDLKNKFPFKVGDHVRIIGSNRRMICIGWNGYGEVMCRHLDGTNHWSGLDPYTLERFPES